ncbi:unnamed protein product [Strongylus vulgaris]|uniref:Uncharacterized protein n=1 Tax=Strongylus vulgaris TaxID=40348 RepID=A0A3P7L888_STRVU|nr:unnamed protein product [Strongylus vulgaris]
MLSDQGNAITTVVEIVSRSAPTTAGTPPKPIFTPFSKLQGASLPPNRLARNKVRKGGHEETEWTHSSFVMRKFVHGTLEASDLS